MWNLVPLLLATQITASAPAMCPVSTPVRATAPPDPNADPVTAYWHISADKLVWAQAGTVGTDIGRYWVRPAGTKLEFTARRLDVPGRPVISDERNGYPTGFYFGSVNIPTEGCWEVVARAGSSHVTFVAEIRYSMEQFARQRGTRVTWAKEIGRILEGSFQLVVTALVLEDPQSITRRARGIRIDVTDGLVSTQLWRDHSSSPSGRFVYERMAGGELPMLRSLGGYYAVGSESGLNIERGDHRYAFPGEQRFAELGQLLLEAYDELNASSW
jgi:hypothetical protein